MNTNHRHRLIVLLSGRGSNYRALRQAQTDGQLPGEIVAVLSDRSDAAGLALARSDGVDAICIERQRYPDRTSFEQALGVAIGSCDAHWIVLAGFMRVLSTEFVQAHAGRMVNIHPSLLPRHRGLHTHRRVLEAGESEHGASVHFVTPELDGGPVISRVLMPVEANDTPERLAERLLPLEHRLLPATMALLLTEPVEVRDEGIYLQDHRLAQPLELGLDLSDDGRLLGRGRHA